MKKKTISHNILCLYRKVQYRLLGRSVSGVLDQGRRCYVLGQETDNSQGDIVHPCVRYISQGFRGHKWWMAYTPYLGANANIENPRLCWGEENGEGSPVKWHIEDIVKNGYIIGYNSDPNLYYENGKLYVYWRENDTDRLLSRGAHRGTFCKVYSETSVEEYDEPVLSEKMEYEDKETCPTFIKTGEVYSAYAMHLRFKNEKIIGKPLIQRIIMLTDLLGIYSQQKFKGVAQWTSESPVSPFQYKHSVKFSNCNKLYRPWHMDLFQYEDALYAIVQTNQSNGDICLAKSTDGVHFRMYSKPLITNKSCGGFEIYKPTALVVNGILYVYYTFQLPEREKYNMLHVSSMDFHELLCQLV